MGNNESYPLLSDTETAINIQGEDREDIPFNVQKNNNLKTLLLSNNRIKILPQELLKLETLDLSNNQLSKLTLNDLSLNYPNLKKLYISQNDLKELPNVINSFENLTDLSADRNCFQDQPNDFTKFTKLENVDLFLNLYSEIPQFPNSLVSLNMGFNKLSILNISLENLRELRLPGNKIGIFSPNSRFPNLRVLDLSMNLLPDLDFRICDVFPKLESFYLSFNFLETFPSSFPETIERIDISNNVLSIWNDDLDNLNNLKTLDVSNNKLTKVPKLPKNIHNFNAECNNLVEVSSFDMKEVNSIQLNNNNFTSIPSLSECAATTLIIKNNQINEIDISKIGEKVIKLDFTSNLIHNIPVELFLVKKIQTLNITKNNVTSLPDGISSSSISALYLNENPISELPNLPLGLTTLSCINCNFEKLPESIFSLKRIQIIDFSNNKIKAVEKFPPARKIYLSCNQIESIPKISDEIVILDISHNELTELDLTNANEEGSPDDDFMMLQELDISHNHLKSITYDNLPVLNLLNMSHNDLDGCELNFSKLPSLKVCDITYTNVKTFPPNTIPKTITELATSNEKLFKKANSMMVKLFQPSRCGYSETCGARSTMEDALIIRENIIPNLNIYAVIDGHGGSATASIASFLVPSLFLEEKEKGISAFSSVCRKLIEKLRSSNIKDGATIAFTIVSKTQISYASLGDTRALIVHKDGTIDPLTVDHKPTDPSERDMIRDNKSFVSDQRTAGVLAVSRSLGDFMIQGVSHLPDIKSRDLKPTDSRLVIACDGVFDVLTPKEVGEIVINEKDVNKAAVKIRNIAISRLSGDNISVIVVDLEKEWL